MTQQQEIAIALMRSKILAPLSWAVVVLSGLLVLFYPSYWQAKFVAIGLVLLGAYQTQAFLSLQSRVTKISLAEEQSFVWIDQVKL